MTTSIDDLIDGLSAVRFQDSDGTFQELKKKILDFGQTEDERIKWIDVFYRTYPSEIQDILSSIFYVATSLQLPSTSEYMCRIVRESSIDPVAKIIVAEMMDGNYKYDTLEYILQHETLSLLFSKRVLYALFESDEHRPRAKEYFYAILDDTSIDPHDQYSYVVDFESNVCVQEMVVYLLRRPHALNVIRILCCQFILYKGMEHVDEAIRVLVEIAGMHDLDMNVRADAVDVLLTAKNVPPEVVHTAVRILAELGRSGGGHTVYDNQQNVHSSSIESSAYAILNALPVGGPNIELITEFLKPYTRSDEVEPADLALRRIRLDRRAPHTLLSILSRVVAYILPHDHRPEMMKRLVEELVDGCRVCSSGLAVRILNVLSGFDDFSIQISFEDQIIANFATLLNHAIMSIPNEYVKEEILVQLAIPTEHFEQRKDFLEFLVQQIGTLRTTLYDEFKDHVSESDFDEYFKKALLTYQGF